MIKFLQFLIFLILQIIFIPFAIIGIILMMYKEMKVTKKLGVSYTAGQAIQGRWIMHYLNTRPEQAIVDFMKVLPNESHFGFLCLMAAAIIANRICGYTPTLATVAKPGEEGLYTFVNVRTMHFHRIMKESVEKVEQVVIMGAGFDLRDLEYTKGKDIKVFELDQEKTQELKLTTMKKAGIDHEWIKYIPIDFNEESWVEKLIENGFNKDKKTFFLWESVSIYLKEDVVNDTLKKMSDLCAKGSIIALDFYSKAFITGETSTAVKKGLKMLEKMGEPWVYGIDMSENAHGNIESLLKEAGLTLNDLVLCGGKGKTKKPFYAIVEAEKL